MKIYIPKYCESIKHKMGKFDDEFEHYLNELNDIVDFSHGLS